MTKANFTLKNTISGICMCNYIKGRQSKQDSTISDLSGLDVGRLLYEAFVAITLRQGTGLDLYPNANTLT